MGVFYKRVLFLFLLVSCNGLEEPAMDLELNYQPLELGNFWEYKVEETVFFGESDAETNQFFYRDQIASDYINEARERVFVVIRQKSMDRQNWVSADTFTYRVTKGSLLKSFENQTVISFVFPPSNGMEWNGNPYNSQTGDDFVMEYQTNYSVDGIDYESAVKVLQSEEDDLITLRNNRYEVFVKEVGLVESYYEVLTYCSRNDCLGKQIVDGGRFTHLKLIDHG